MLDWNDLRYFLAVADAGSTLRAAQALRVSQTTVARRIVALEQAIGLALFDRQQAGYRPTSAGTDLLAHARQVEAAAKDFAEAAAAESREVSGAVRITTEEVYATALLMPILPVLHELHPKIVIDLDTSQAVRDLGAGEADIALRSCKASTRQPAGLVGRQLCPDDWTLYCSRSYADQHGVPRTRADLRDHPLIGGGGGNLWIHYKAWLESLGLEDQVAMHHATSGGLLSGVRSGFGLAVLPCIIGDSDPELVRCFPAGDSHERELWLFTHERVRHTPRVRTVVDFLYERLIALVRRLEAQRTAAA